MRKWLGLLVYFCSYQFSQAEEIRVAVASNFMQPMRDIVTLFERSSEHKVMLSFGSSGKFVAQIRHGAPFHVFFSADQAKPKALEKRGLAVSQSRFTYAMGGLVLWSSKEGGGDDNLRRLKAGDFRKLALANPKLAPYGTAAVEVLSNLGIRDKTRANWVRGENIAQTYQFLVSGNADIGFVALSQIVNKDARIRGSSWVIPKELYSPIRQDALLLKRGEHSPGAKALLNFFTSEPARKLINHYGYTTPLDIGEG